MLRLVMPNTLIDLFTDQTIENETFSRIHRLDHVSHRPKMEALRRSRFGRSIYLDADTIPIASLDDLFDILDHGAFAAAQAVARPKDMLREQTGIPRCYPYFNSGVIAMRRGRATLALLQAWERAVIEGALPFDQPPLRQLVHDMGIPFQVLPLEYNLIHIPALDVWENHFGAPLVLHVRALHDLPVGDPTTPFDLDIVLGTMRADKVRRLLRRTVRGPNGGPHPLVRPLDAAVPSDAVPRGQESEIRN